jgi:lipoyl(octanoyl) transferase
MMPTIFATYLGLVDYRQVLRVQHALHTRCRATGENALVLTQHHPVVTLGYRCPTEQLRLSVADLAAHRITVAEIERGGGATYHGPGQLIAYPIFSSLLRRCGVRGLVTRLEDVMSRVCGRFGVAVGRRPGFPGIWREQRKLGAVGIAVRRGVSLHGCALNINLDLRPFSYIVPCGLIGTEVTSLERERGRSITVAEVAPEVRQCFAEVFAASMEDMPDEWRCIERETGAGALDYYQPPGTKKCD